MPSVAEAILAKTPLPTHLDSATIRARVAADIRQRAFFSARMTSLTYLKQLQTIVGAFAEGKINAADARWRCQQALRALGLDNGGHALTDHGSARRLNLVIDTQRRMGSAMAQMDLSKDPEILEAFPAWELRSGGYRRVHRTDWPERWQAAGEACGWTGACRDRMVALKTSPIWEHLGQGAGGFKDTLGNPFPPFAFGSSYVWLDVSLPKAMRYGLIGGISALNKRDTHGHFAETEGEACTHEKGKQVKERKQTIQTGYKGKCSQKEAADLLNAGFSIKDGEGQGVRFDRFARDHYEKGLRRKDNQPKPENLELLPVAIYAVRHGECTLKFPKGTTPDYLNPPKGTQRVYSMQYGRERMKVYVYVDSGKVSGWHTEK